MLLYRTLRRSLTRTFFLPSTNTPTAQSSSLLRRFFSSPSPATMDAAKTKAQTLIDENDVMVFSKSYCPYCRNAKSTLKALNVNFKAIELDQEADGSEIQAALQDISGQRTVPNIYIAKEHIGGNDDLTTLKGNGGLVKKLQASNISVNA